MPLLQHRLVSFLHRRGRLVFSVLFLVLFTASPVETGQDIEASDQLLLVLNILGFVLFGLPFSIGLGFVSRALLRYLALHLLTTAIARIPDAEFGEIRITVAPDALTVQTPLTKVEADWTLIGAPKVGKEFLFLQQKAGRVVAAIPLGTFAPDSELTEFVSSIEHNCGTEPALQSRQSRFHRVHDGGTVARIEVRPAKGVELKQPQPPI